jgi:hypothetical protein
VVRARPSRCAGASGPPCHQPGSAGAATRALVWRATRNKVERRWAWAGACCPRATPEGAALPHAFSSRASGGVRPLAAGGKAQHLQGHASGAVAELDQGPLSTGSAIDAGAAGQGDLLFGFWLLYPAAPSRLGAPPGAVHARRPPPPRTLSMELRSESAWTRRRPKTCSARGAEGQVQAEAARSVAGKPGGFAGPTRLAMGLSVLLGLGPSIAACSAPLASTPERAWRWIIETLSDCCLWLVARWAFSGWSHRTR